MSALYQYYKFEHYYNPRHELPAATATRYKQHVHVRSNAASMRHTVAVAAGNPYLSRLTAQ